MNRHRLALAGALLALGLSAAPAHATEVGVSIEVSQPGVYGRIDIGQFPRPQVIVAQPVIIEKPVRQVAQPGVVYVQPQPVYLWVPPGHRKNWRKHCREYGACGVPVYFVDDRWYDSHVHPRGKGKGRDKDRGKGHGKGKDD